MLTVPSCPECKFYGGPKEGCLKYRNMPSCGKFGCAFGQRPLWKKVWYAILKCPICEAESDRVDLRKEFEGIICPHCGNVYSSVFSICNNAVISCTEDRRSVEKITFEKFTGICEPKPLRS